MKKTIAFFIPLLSIFNCLFAQELKATYKFDIPVNHKNIQYKEGHKIKVTDTTVTDSISFVYLKFKGNSNTAKKLNNKYYYIDKDHNSPTPKPNKNNQTTNDTIDLKTHTITKSIFNNSTTRHHFYHRFKNIKAGMFTVPFKLRLDDFDFEQNVNLGMSLSFRFRMNRHYDNDWLISPTLGIGISTVKLNAKNSNLEANSDDNNRTASALSLSAGILVELKENINLSLQYGFDLLGNDDKEIEWKYNKKPWLGVGISVGFPITKSDVENENSTNKTE